MAVASRSVDLGYVCLLTDPRARDAELAGAKAAALAAAGGNGLPIIPGFVVTTHAHADYLAAGRTFRPELMGVLVEAWQDFTAHGQIGLVVRSSSTVEDIGTSSMAGRFRSVLDVRDRDAFLDALVAVFASADAVGGGQGPNPMGVLVQQYLVPNRSGVMFGVDPVTGDRSTVVVEAVVGGPDKLVSGRVSAQHYVLSRRGRLLSVDHVSVRHRFFEDRHQRLLHTGELVALVRLAHQAEQVFGPPQDVEWAITDDGALRLLQSRPVTATSPPPVTTGPVLGPGPLGETFPDPLGELEIDLWVHPLRDGVVDAMAETRAVPAARIATSPVVTTVNGRVAADLELFGYVRKHSRLRLLDPRPGVRQLRTAWRIGALRAELPSRVTAQVDEVDRWLTSVDPSVADDPQLADLLEKSVDVLRRLHHSEALAGTLLPPASATMAALALRILATADPNRDDDLLVREHPVLLSLVPPSLGRPLVLARRVSAPPDVGHGPIGEREQLRLRARWVHEMTVRVTRELAGRIAARGVLGHPDDIGLLHLDELRPLLYAAGPPEDLEERRGKALATAFSAPLPAEFRLSEVGDVVPAARLGARPGYGTPAGGGRGVGRTCHGSVSHPPAPGDVLVVRTLEPGLATVLPGLAGLVSETGASLSHLAILAREYGVPTVVAVHDALTRFPPGSRVLVDGGTGEVRTLGSEEAP